MTVNTATRYDAESHQLTCQGDWDVKHIPEQQNALVNLILPTAGVVTINGAAITKMDSAGAWLLNSIIKQIHANGAQTVIEHFAAAHESLLNIIAKRMADEGELPALPQETEVATLGKNTARMLSEAIDYLAFVGYLSFETIRIAANPKKIRWSAFVNVIYRNGVLALPIIALLSFMIGVVIAYQMGLQLKNYGANIYIVDLQGLAVLREFGPLLTAIMLAGRTGSAFTAQLGMMKINQEIDALNTMGVTPAELLLLPRIFGLLIALPLLTIWSDAFGVAGGIVMANNMLNITPYDFMHRFPHVIPLRALLIGIGKAPVFALIISSIGCFQGMKVESNADSVGRNTTRSVVLAIFFIIVADALFSVIFSKLKL